MVCTFNRLNYLKKCLDSLLKIDFDDYEIIVVNDGSTDGTKIFLDGLISDKIRVIHQNNQGLSAARNSGIKKANYDIIVFTDDDCEVDTEWLTELAKVFADDKVSFVMGQTFYVSKGYNGYFPERMVSNSGAKWPMGCNVAYRKQVFDVCGDFDDFFFRYNNEDSEMAIRAVSKDFSFARAPKAVVYHQPVNWTVGPLLKSAKNASVWPLLKKKYPNHYLMFGPPIKFGLIVNIKDYFYLLTLPLFLPFLFVRYVMHGKRDFKIFFIKWPICLILRRYYIYKEAVKSRVVMF